MGPDTLQMDERHRLSIGGVRVADLAEEYGTPLYVMDEVTMRRRLQAFARLLAETEIPTRLVYAGKAFLCEAMAGWLKPFGVGLDVVSGGELYTALAADYDPAKIVFHGNVKPAAELRYALKAGVGQIVVDSLSELQSIEQEAAALGVRARVLLRLTPGIDAHTHAFIRTGQFDSKFGFGLADGIGDEAIKSALDLPHVDLLGFHAHIGSQILEAEPFLADAEALLEYALKWYRQLGYWPHVLDIGGGFGVRYAEEDHPPDLRPVFRQIATAMRKMTPSEAQVPELAIEPGRSIVGEAGVTLYRVAVVKRVPGGKRYVAVDGGMGDNIRPALYQAVYQARLDGKAVDGPVSEFTVAGRYCESGDILMPSVRLPEPATGDLLVTLATGAYNYSMASNYNRIPRPAVVLVADGKASVWVERESWADLTRRDRPYAAASTPNDV